MRSQARLTLQLRFLVWLLLSLLLFPLVLAVLYERVHRRQPVNLNYADRRDGASTLGYKGKRALDFALTVPALIAFLPLVLVIALLVRIRMGSPVLFCQQRPGLYGKPFTMYKFRTMTDARDSAGRLLSDADRLTCLGGFLRSTSLDELPELFNVLIGDMSLVGPRPLLIQYLDRYTPEQAQRHEVRPGITGWAQINGRNAITWEEKFALDIWYVENCSLWLDIKIILLTISKVVRREGITNKDCVTMPEFYGSSQR